MNLDELIKTENFLLLDCSGINLRNSSNIISQIISLDPIEITNYCNHLEHLTLLIRDFHILTIDEVFLEFSKVHKLQTWYYGQTKRFKNNGRSKTNRILKHKGSYIDSNLIPIFISKTKKLSNALQNSRLDASCFENPEGYSLIEEFVIRISKMFNLKKDESSKPTDHLRTDEKLIATAVYMSLFQDTSTGIISNDSDLRRLLFSSYDILTYDHHTNPVENICNKLFDANNIKIYTHEYGQYISEAIVPCDRKRRCYDAHKSNIRSLLTKLKTRLEMRNGTASQSYSKKAVRTAI